MEIGNISNNVVTQKNKFHNDSKVIRFNPLPAAFLLYFLLLSFSYNERFFFLVFSFLFFSKLSLPRRLWTATLHNLFQHFIDNESLFFIRFVLLSLCYRYYHYAFVIIVMLSLCFLFISFPFVASEFFHFENLNFVNCFYFCFTFVIIVFFRFTFIIIVFLSLCIFSFCNDYFFCHCKVLNN